MGLSPTAAADLQPQTLSELMPLSDLKDPAKLQQLTERFTAMYDYTYGPGSGATTSLTADSGNSASEAIRRGLGPLQHHQFERLGPGRRVQQLHRRDAADLLDRADVEHVEADAGRIARPAARGLSA